MGREAAPRGSGGRMRPKRPHLPTPALKRFAVESPSEREREEGCRRKTTRMRQLFKRSDGKRATFMGVRYKAQSGNER